MKNKLIYAAIALALAYVLFQAGMLAWNWDYLTRWQDPEYLAGERTATYYTWRWPL